MALIPTEVGVNLRTQVDSPLRPASPVSELPADLPDLQPGQVFSARIVEVLPEATYRALVAGKTITLALPSSAQSGDTLELVVVDKTARMVSARLADPAGNQSGQEGEGYPHATFSAAARMISNLLTADGEPARPAVLNRGTPLLAAPEDTPAGDLAAKLAPQLEKAVSQSGLFYESHQAKWVAGQVSTESLLEEPQNQPSQGTPRTAAKPASDNPPTAVGDKPPSLPVIAKDRVATDAGNEPATGATAASVGKSPVPVPDDLRHMVQQQLDAAATQRLVWHGEVWPQQTMEWQIQQDGQRGQEQDDAESQWTTRLALTTPRLGRVEATLELRGQGLHVNLVAPAGQSVDDLRQAAPQLAASLEAAGIPALSLRIRQREAAADV